MFEMSRANVPNELSEGEEGGGAEKGEDGEQGGG